MTDRNPRSQRASRILVVAPGEARIADLRERLSGMGHAACAAVPVGERGPDAVARAVDKAAATRPDLAVIDLGHDGDSAASIAAAEQLRDRFDVRAVYLTDTAEGPQLERARMTDPLGYVLKPVDERQLRLTIDAALSVCRHERRTSELLDKAHLMEAIFSSLSDGIVVTSTDGDFLFVNSAAQEIVGMGPTDTAPDQWAETYGTFYPDETTPCPSDRLPLVRAMGGEVVDHEELFIRNAERPNGVAVSVSARPLLDSANRPYGGVIVLRDITELKQKDTKLRRTIAELEDQTRLMETIFNSISDGVVVADGQGRFTLFNPSAERMIGIGMTAGGPEQWTETYGIFYLDQVTPVPTEQLPLVRAIRGEPSDEMEMFIRNQQKPNGVFISVSGRALVADQGAVRGGVIVFRDVTERVRAEEALARAFDQGRLEVVDTILHNIGNAISSVVTGVGTISDTVRNGALVDRFRGLATALEEHRDDWVSYLRNDPQGQLALPFIMGLAEDFAAQNERLRRTVERVESRVTHIVDIIRTQRSFDYDSMARKDIDLHQTIDDAARMLEDSFVALGIEVRIDCDRAPREIRVQESRLHQVLVNLIKNAIEAIENQQESFPLPAPCIRIDAYASGDSLTIDVIDNGIGIEAERSRRIFAPGYTTKNKGSGLGLHSAASFINGSGGSIQALSDGPGQGTTMRVTLPRSSVAPPGSRAMNRGGER